MQIQPRQQSYSFLRRSIVIPKIKQKVKDTALLSDNRCVILFQSKCVIVDLNQQNPRQTQIMTISTTYDKRIIIPLPDGSFYIYILECSGEAFYYDKKSGIKTIYTTNMRDNYYAAPLLFHNTGNVFIVSEDQNVVVLKNLMNNANKDFIIRNRPQHKQLFYGSLDQQKLILKSFQPNKHFIIAQDIQLKKQIEIPLPQIVEIQDIKYRTVLIKIINHHLFLIGKLKKRVLELSIWNGLEQAYSTLLMREDIEFFCINSINKSKQRACITICKGNGKNKEAYLIWLNYKSKGIVWQHKVKNYSFRYNQTLVSFRNTFELNKRISNDLQNYVQVDQEKLQLHHYHQVKPKKLLFHLWKNSRLERDFGESLIKKILYVTL